MASTTYRSTVPITTAGLRRTVSGADRIPSSHLAHLGIELSPVQPEAIR